MQLLPKNNSNFLFDDIYGKRANIREIKKTLSAKMILKETGKYLIDIENIPQTSYGLFQKYFSTNKRGDYEKPYHLKRTKLTAAVLHFIFYNRKDLLNNICDYICSICEETTWAIPAHPEKIGLTSAETALMLAEIVKIMESYLPKDIINRVENEIDTRIFIPYLTQSKDLWWYKGPNNWNSVCNSCIGAVFLYLEKDEKRLAKGIGMVLEGLKVYIDKAFEKDGGTTEGLNYWQYGLLYYVIFSELLKKRTKGKTNLLSSNQIKQISEFPFNANLSPGNFITFSDYNNSHFLPGVISKLAEQTKSKQLINLISTFNNLEYGLSKFPIALRNILWWDGKKTSKYCIPHDTFLPKTEIVKTIVNINNIGRSVLAVKAGNNNENHNHNDIGSFILHINGETFLCDPGSGLYTRNYFTSRRYENIFANSFGHSVPVIDGQLQGTGKNYLGKILSFKSDKNEKQIVIEFAKAYDIANIKSLRRILTLKPDKNNIMSLKDSFVFKRIPKKIEESLVTYLPVKSHGSSVHILGKENILELMVKEPKGLRFSITILKKESMENSKPITLKRITCIIKQPLKKELEIKILMRILPKNEQI